MRYEDILITPNQYLGGQRQAERYLANPAAKAFQTGNMLYNAGGPVVTVPKQQPNLKNTMEPIQTPVVKEGQVPSRTQPIISTGSNGNGSSGGSNGNSGGNNSSNNGNKKEGNQPPIGKPVESDPTKDPADQKDSKSKQNPEQSQDQKQNPEQGQDQKQKPDSSQYLYWAIPAVSIAIAIAIYFYANS